MIAPLVDTEDEDEVCANCETRFDECARCGVIVCDCDREDHEEICTEEPEGFD